MLKNRDFSDQKKMEKAKFKKNIHFTNEEEIFVAKMISDGAEELDFFENEL